MSSDSRLPKEDRGLPLRCAPPRFCPRKLTREGFNAKRYMSVGPLFGYMLACPACGFVEMHTHEQVGFVEVDGLLSMTERPARCMLCTRVISVAGGVILAVSYARPEGAA